MKFFVDTADVNEIRELNDLGLIDGVTTNPSLIMKSGRDIREVTKEICSIVDGPVSAEVAATEYDAMMKEAAVLAKIADNICIKLPLTLDGLKACRALTSDGHQTNVTLCFSANQALLAAKAGATFISPFIGRLDDIAIDGMDLIREIRQIYDNYGFETEILAASIRTVNHVKEAALIGADVATIPASTIKSLVKHPAHRQGPGSLPRRLEEDRSEHRLIRLAGSRLMKSI
jgi:transaldolase